MLKIKNKFIVFIIVAIIAIIWLQIFASPSLARDTHTYLSLVKWDCLLNVQPILKDKKYVLVKADEVETKKDSIAVIEWGDGSVTRMAENTKITIKNNMVVWNGGSIEIAFDLLKGKSWSKVTSFISGDSYFKEYIDNLEAGVRGTEFEVDKDREFLSVKSHEVTLTNTGGTTYKVEQDQALSLVTFSIIDLEKFISQFQDKAWEQINQQMNVEFLSKLKENFSHQTQTQFLENMYSYFMTKYSVLKDIKNEKWLDEVAKKFDSLGAWDKKFVYDRVKILYQSINYAGVGSEEFKNKVYLRKVLFLLSDNEDDKKALTLSSVYDVQEMLQSKNYTFLVDTMRDLKTSQEYLKGLNIDPSQLFKTAPIVPDDIKALIQEKIGNIKDFQIPTLDINSIIPKNTIDINKINKDATNLINQALDSGVKYLKKK